MSAKERQIIVKIPAAAVAEPKLSSSAKLLLIVLADREGSNGQAWPTPWPR